MLRLFLLFGILVVISIIIASTCTLPKVNASIDTPIYHAELEEPVPVGSDWILQLVHVSSDNAAFRVHNLSEGRQHIDIANYFYLENGDNEVTTSCSQNVYIESNETLTLHLCYPPIHGLSTFRFLTPDGSQVAWDIII